MTQIKSKFYRVLLIIYSLISIGSTAYLLMPREDHQSEKRYRETKEELKTIKEYLKQRDASYEQTIDSLTQKSDSLQSVISVTDKRLRHSRSQVKILSVELNHYVDEFDRDTSLKKNSIAFDSLSEMSRDFMYASIIRDSLCDFENSTLKDLVQVKDSVIGLSDSLLRDYKSSVEQLLLTSNDLNTKLQKTEKKLKRKTRFNRVALAAAIVFSGLLVSKSIIQPH